MTGNMLKLLSEFLRGPGNSLQQERYQKIVIISLCSLLFACVLLAMLKSPARRRDTSGSLDTTPTPIAPAPTQTKWWIRREPSQTPTRLISTQQTPINDTETIAVSSECPHYAKDFSPGTFGYISLSPPYENLVRSGAGKHYSPIGFIEIGGWVKILGEPVCTDDGYVWLNVESAKNANNWTAGGYRTAQWVIPCPDPSRKCAKDKPGGSIAATPYADNDDEVSNPNTCASDKLAVGLDAQISPHDLLVVRSEPFTGNVIGRIAPLVVINILDGPICAGGAVWWKVWGPQTGWAVENHLRACPKEGDCDPWEEKQSLQ